MSGPKNGANEAICLDFLGELSHIHSFPAAKRYMFELRESRIPLSEQSQHHSEANTSGK